MKFQIKCIISILLLLRYIPHLISYAIHPIVREDVRFWLKCYGLKSNTLVGVLYFLTFFPEYRNVLYKRCYISLVHRLLAPSAVFVYNNGWKEYRQRFFYPSWLCYSNFCQKYWRILYGKSAGHYWVYG